MSYSVELTEALLDDLFDLHRWIAGQTDEMVADGYLDRIRTRIASLAEFPDRGTPRDELVPGVRSLTFERRIVLLYRVQGSSVAVLRAIGGAQDLASVYEGGGGYCPHQLQLGSFAAKLSYPLPRERRIRGIT